jgi:hypothetical protein
MDFAARARNEARKAYLGMSPSPVKDEMMGIIHDCALAISFHSYVMSPHLAGSAVAFLLSAQSHALTGPSLLSL